MPLDNEFGHEELAVQRPLLSEAELRRFLASPNLLYVRNQYEYIFSYIYATPLLEQHGYSMVVFIPNGEGRLAYFYAHLKDYLAFLKSSEIQTRACLERKNISETFRGSLKELLHELNLCYEQLSEM